jgi:hypothetical protein
MKQLSSQRSRDWLKSWGSGALPGSCGSLLVLDFVGPAPIPPARQKASRRPPDADTEASRRRGYFRAPQGPRRRALKPGNRPDAKRAHSFPRWATRARSAPTVFNGSCTGPRDGEICGRCALGLPSPSSAQPKPPCSDASVRKKSRSTRPASGPLTRCPRLSTNGSGKFAPTARSL